ncbi:HNH endonuclease [Bacillus sp. UMB0893]|uniref:HNH endonuclease n=1 Tax=Bacillus sp. UMB0893 TaxID=2066053 RepID=UPI000C769BCC|nr:HNH endonuclease [Bacillus sp. UMB0893]PLR65983.1 hypothetical protein CYJ36_20120 [Bacillus sp. UMB0893]
MMSTCRVCKKEKPRYEFEKDSRVKSEDGRTNRCRECKSAANNKAYKAFGRLKEKYPKYGIEIEITKEEVAQLFDAVEGSCYYCGVEESEETGTLQLEHIRPLSQGGRNHISNLLISCRSCNAKKRDKPIVAFYHEYGRFDYYYLPSVIKHIAYFTKRTTEEVEAELVAEYHEYMAEKKRTG